MSHPLTIELSDAAYDAPQLCARAAAQSAAAVAAAALEQQFGARDEPDASGRTAEAERKAARERFERHFGEVNMGRATGPDNEGIDADLACAYADSHEEG